MKPIDKIPKLPSTHPVHMEAARIELLINAKRKPCRECKHVRAPETIAPQCSLHRQVHLMQFRITIEKAVATPVFCHVARKNEHMCSWDGHNWEKPESINRPVDPKYAGDE